MERIIILDQTRISPFFEPARDLRLLNKPLWLMQRDLLKTHCKGSTEINTIDELAEKTFTGDRELLVYRDNLFFNGPLIDTFIAQARAAGRPCQIAFRASGPSGRGGDPSIERHALQLCSGIVRRDDVSYLAHGEERRGPVHVADLYYFPDGPSADITPLVIDTLSHEMGYYHIPSYMASKGDLTYQIPLRAFLSVESWLHVFMANVLMGVFTAAATQDVKMGKARLREIFKWTREDWQIFPGKLRFSASAILMRLNPLKEMWRNHFLASPALVKIGKNSSIDPSATIHGPTTIGDNVYVGPGVVIANSIIGNNVNIMQGSQVMLSVVSDRCFLPFNAGLFMTTLMENSMVAQNSTLQMTVVGRNTFIGANNSFTDFNLQNEPIKVMHRGRPVEVNLPVLGSALGHNVKVGSGFIVYPGREIESNAVIIFDNDKNLIRKTVVGHDLDDMDEARGEPRRIIYHWPNVYYDPARSRDEPVPEDPLDRTSETESAAQEQSGHTNGTHPSPNRAGAVDWPTDPGAASEAAVPLDTDRPTVGASASVRRNDR